MAETRVVVQSIGNVPSSAKPRNNTDEAMDPVRLRGQTSALAKVCSKRACSNNPLTSRKLDRPVGPAGVRYGMFERPFGFVELIRVHLRVPLYMTLRTIGTDSSFELRIQVGQQNSLTILLAPTSS